MYIFRKSLSMTQIIDPNGFWVKMFFPKFWTFNASLTHLLLPPNYTQLYLIVYSLKKSENYLKQYK